MSHDDATIPPGDRWTGLPGRGGSRPASDRGPIEVD